jgi:ABC-type polysaccharide/polyol phosphate transport system ATPase subunit
MKKTQANVIVLDRVYKEYQVRHEKPTLTDAIFMRGYTETFQALSDITLNIQKGEKVGFIGRNGSGKTTLLKIIAEIAAPTKGLVTTVGKVVSLIDLEAGFHPDLSGVENVYLNGLIIGMSKKEIDSKVQNIMAFADIGTIINAPFYTYSQGMKLRLGFSVGVHSDPDILILDEGLGAGDAAFTKKASAKIQEFFKQNKTILVVTHWFDFLEKNCNRIIKMDEGKIVADGGIELLKI